MNTLLKIDTVVYWLLRIFFLLYTNRQTDSQASRYVDMQADLDIINKVKFCVSGILGLFSSAFISVNMTWHLIALWHVKHLRNKVKYLALIFCYGLTNSYGVPFVPLHLHMKDKLNIFSASISKWNLDFKIEVRFRNRA